MEAHTVGLVLADRQQAFAEGLGIILDATDGFAVLGLAHTPARTVQLAAAHRPAALRLGSLSCREREVLGLLARGWSTGRIADGLQVAQCTVRSHVYNLLGKLDLHSRLEAAAFALERDRDQFGELGNARGELLVELLQR